MKAFLLAGGEGQRLRPMTDRMPKCLVPIRGIPLLAIWLDALERHGICEALVNVSRHHELVERVVDARLDRLPRVHLVREGRPVGNAGTVAANRAFVEGEESFWIIYSDNLTNMALTPMLAFHRTHNDPLTMALFRAPVPRAAGIVTMEPGGRIVGFTEKPEQPESDLANAGIYLARPSLFEWMPIGPGVVDFGTDVLPRLVGAIHGYVVPEYFRDIGTPESLARAEAEWPGA